MFLYIKDSTGLELVGILRDNNKCSGRKKIIVVYPEGCYHHYFFKHDIKYYVVLKNCERFFVLFSRLLRHWYRAFLWFSLPGAKVDKIKWFLKLFIYFFYKVHAMNDIFVTIRKYLRVTTSDFICGIKLSWRYQN